MTRNRVLILVVVVAVLLAGGGYLISRVVGGGGQARSIDLTVSGTTSRSKLTILGARSTTPVLNDVTVNGPLGTLRIDHAFINGIITINGSIKEVRLPTPLTGSSNTINSLVSCRAYPT